MAGHPKPKRISTSRGRGLRRVRHRSLSLADGTGSWQTTGASNCTDDGCVSAPSGRQSQFSATLEAQTRESRPLGDLLAWLPDHLRRDLSIDSLARRTAMRARNFARSFRQDVGKTPAKHIKDLRLEAARRKLESTTMSADEVADACGLASAEVLRRLFRRRLQVMLGQYRASFGQSGVH
jgi:transcriptional regulator GlxA family with amidase domain